MSDIWQRVQLTRQHGSGQQTVPELETKAPSTRRTTKIKATKTGFKLETTLKGHQYWVWDCAFSADSAYLVTAASDTIVRLWELASGQIIRQYNGHTRGAISVALNDV